MQVIFSPFFYFLIFFYWLFRLFYYLVKIITHTRVGARIKDCYLNMNQSFCGMEVLTLSQRTDGYTPHLLIITCEACRDVHYLDAVSEDDVADKFNRFQCKKGCERVYYSYITVGQIILESVNNQVIEENSLLPNKIAAAGQ